MIEPSGFIFSCLIIISSVLFVLLNFRVTSLLLDNKKYLTIFQAFNLYYFILIYIGAVGLNVYKFEYEKIFGFYSRPDVVFKIWLLSSSALILMPMGAIIYNQIVNFSPKLALRDFDGFEVVQTNVKKSTYKISIFFFTLLIICLVVFALYKSAVGDLAVLHIFQKLNPSEFSTLRSDATNNFTGKFSRYQIFLSTVPNFLLIVSFLMRSKNLFWKLLFILTLLLAIFFALINVEKAPVMGVLLLLLFSHLFMFPKLNLKKILIVVISGLVIIFLLYTTVMGMGDRELGEIFGAIFHRIFIGQAHPLFWWQLYLEEHGTLGFGGMPNPGGILPFTPISMTVLIHQFAFPEIAKTGIVGSMPTVYFAYPMLSFGYICSLISMVVFGMLIQFVDHIFSLVFRRKPNIFQIALYVLLIGFFLHYVADGFEGILFDFNWIVPTFIVVLFTLFSRNYNI